MVLPHLALAPDADSYSQQEGAEVIAVSLDGGAGRYRRDKIGAARMVNVKWTMNPLQYRYFRAFWHTAIKRGALAFTCDLVSEDGAGPVAHECNVVPGTVGMPTQGGLTYTQAMTLEVKPLPVDDDLNESVMLLFNAGMDDDDLAALGRMINITMPELFGA